MERISRTFYWMAIPALVLFAIFHTIPLLQGIFYSFTDYRGFGELELRRAAELLCSHAR
jgi:raffinose/stachyose/melibiose transport system permease protein